MSTTARRVTAVATLALVGAGLAAPAAMADTKYPPANNGNAVPVVPGVLYPGGKAAGGNLPSNGQVGSGTTISFPCSAPAGSIAVGSTTAGNLQKNGSSLPVKFTKPGTYKVTVCGISYSVTVKAGQSASGGGGANAGGSGNSGGSANGGGGAGTSNGHSASGGGGATASGSGLAHTGGDGLGAVWFGAGLIALGGGFVVTTARRRGNA